MKYFATASIILAGILWGTIGLFVRSLSAFGFGSFEIVGLRSFVTVSVMGIFLLIFHRGRFRIRLKDCWCFIGTGVFSILFFNFCYFTAIDLTSLSTASILLYTAPIFVMLLSLFLFREKITAKKIAALILAFAGCVLVAGVDPQKGLSFSGPGLLFGVGAGFGYALYSIFGRYALRKGYDTFTIMFYTFLFSSAGSLFFINAPVMAGKIASHPLSLPWILGLSIVTCVFAYLLYTYGLKSVESSKASIMASIEPIVATLVGFFAFGEQLTPWSFGGIVLVLVALTVLNVRLPVIQIPFRRFGRRPQNPAKARNKDEYEELPLS